MTLIIENYSLTMWYWLGTATSSDKTWYWCYFISRVSVLVWKFKKKEEFHVPANNTVWDGRLFQLFSALLLLPKVTSVMETWFDKTWH